MPEAAPSWEDTIEAPTWDQTLSAPPVRAKPEALIEGRTVLPPTPQEVSGSFKDVVGLDVPLVNPELVRGAIDIGTAGMGQGELTQGLRETATEQIAGLTTPRSVAMAPAFAIPVVGEGMAYGLGAKAVGEGAGQTVGALESGNLREAGRGMGNVAGGAIMAAAPLLHKFNAPAKPPVIPDLPPEIKAAAEQAATILPKSAEAAAAEVTTTPEVPKEVQDAGQITSTTSVPEREIRAPVGEEAPLRSEGEAPGTQDAGNVAPVSEEAPGKVPLSPMDEAARIAAMTPDQFAEATRTGELKGGFTGKALEIGKRITTPEEIAKLKEHEAAALNEYERALAAEDPQAMSNASAKKQFFTEAIEAAVGITDQKSKMTTAQIEAAKAAGIPAAAEAPKSTASKLPDVEVKLRGKDTQGRNVELSMKADVAERYAMKRKSAFEAIRECLLKAA
jgi:hypothetical protein